MMTVNDRLSFFGAIRLLEEFIIDKLGDQFVKV